MQVKSNRFAGRSTFLMLLMVLPAASQAQYAYDIVRLSAEVYSLNNNGQVGATIYIPTTPGNSTPHAAYYSDGTIHDITPYDTFGSEAYAINDAGLLTINTNSRPAIYDTNTGTTRFLPFFTRALNQNDINAAGDIAISDNGTSYIYHYSTNQVEVLNATTNVALHAINNQDVVVGHLGQRAAYYSNGYFHDIGTLPGGGISDANDINDNGDMVGQSDLSVNGSHPQHAFLYRNNVMQDLGTLTPNTSSAAYGINAAGDIVGNSGYRPFLYRNGQMQDLFTQIDPSLGYTAGSAIAINDKGWILGNSNRGAFLMTPRAAVTPAPGSLLVCGLGGGLLALRLRRRYR